MLSTINVTHFFSSITRQRPNRQQVHGCARITTIRGAPPPKRYFFLSRLDCDTDTDMLKRYIDGKGVHNIELSVVSNVNARYKSYKLSVNIGDKDTIMCAEMWPSGTYIEKWRVRDYGGRNQR